MKNEEIKGKSNDELKTQSLQLRKEAFNLRFQKAFPLVGKVKVDGMFEIKNKFTLIIRIHPYGFALFVCVLCGNGQVFVRPF